MIETKFIWRFCLTALAVWRVTHLLSEEDGPWGSVARLRTKLGAGAFGRLMDCFYCVSLWVSLPLAVWMSDGWFGLLVHWQVLSGAACLFQKSTAFSEAAAPALEGLAGDGANAVAIREAC